MSMFRISLSMMLLGASSLLHAAPGSWTAIGPDGGRINDLVANPVVANSFYSIARGGVYKSIDGGLSWSVANTGITSNFLACVAHHRSQPDVLYTGGNGGVMKSIDAAANWTAASSGLPATVSVTDLSLSPVAPDTVYAATIEHGVYRTTNGAANWTAANTGLVTGIDTVQVSPVNASRVYAGARDIGTGLSGLFETLDGGMTWTDVSGLLPSPYSPGVLVTDVEFAGFAGEIYVVTQVGVFKSDDDGVSFSSVPQPFGERIAANPSNSNELIISGGYGLWRSSDAGASWTQTLADFAGNTSEVAVSTAIIYDPFNPARKLAGTESNGVYLQSANGAPWVLQATGMNSLTIRGLAVHPVDTDQLYAGVGDVFSPSLVHFSSSDRGVSWTDNNSGLGALHFRDIEVDPFTAATVAGTHVYAVGRDLPALDFSGMFSDADGGIYKSTDGGVNWTTIDSGIPLNAGPPTSTLFGTVRDITLDLGSSVGGGPVQTLYVAGTGRYQDDGMGTITKLAGVIYKSTDAGASWSVSDNGIDGPSSGSFPAPSAVKVVIDPTDSSILYAATFIGGYDPATPPTFNNGIWKSTDAGANWVHSSVGLPTIPVVDGSEFSVLSLAIDPTQTSRLYASVHDPDTFESQIYKSEDAGASWAVANTGIATSDVRDVRVDSMGVAYAAAAGNSGNPGGVYRSTDNGLSWHSISVGLDANVSVLQLNVDESGATPVLFAGTTQSIHSYEVVPDGDVDGASNTTEGASPNAGDGNDDGLPDGEQPQVASLPATPIDAGLYGHQEPFRGGADEYVTISVTPIDGNCSSLEDAQSLSDTQVPNDPPRSFDHGIMRFGIVDCEQATVELTFHGSSDFSSPDWSLRIFAPSQADPGVFAWQTLPATVQDNVWTVTLTDGLLGDLRPNNGRILFQGGPALFNESIFENSFED